MEKTSKLVERFIEFIEMQQTDRWKIQKNMVKNCEGQSGNVQSTSSQSSRRRKEIMVGRNNKQRYKKEIPISYSRS